MKENAIEKIIEVLRKLQELGVQVSQINQGDTIERVAKRFGISEERLAEKGLKPEYKIGSKLNFIINAYRGNGNGKLTLPTEGQVKMLLEMGIKLEKDNKDSKNNMETTDFINLLKRLHEMEICICRLTFNDTIQSLAQKSEITREKLEELGVEPDYTIGLTYKYICDRYRGTRGGEKVTEEANRALEDMGVYLKKRSTYQELIDLLERLQRKFPNNNIDFSKLKTMDTTIAFVEKYGITEDMLFENYFDPEYQIGRRKSTIQQRINKNPRTEETKKMIERLEKFGVDCNPKKITVPELLDAMITNGELPHVQICDNMPRMKGIEEKAVEVKV